jgi:uncharacterized membrane protein YraQ (UPF0718 family)
MLNAVLEKFWELTKWTLFAAVSVTLFFGLLINLDEIRLYVSEEPDQIRALIAQNVTAQKEKSLLEDTLKQKKQQKENYFKDGNTDAAINMEPEILKLNFEITEKDAAIIGRQRKAENMYPIWIQFTTVIGYIVFGLASLLSVLSVFTVLKEFIELLGESARKITLFIREWVGKCWCRIKKGKKAA